MQTTRLIRKNQSRIVRAKSDTKKYREDPLILLSKIFLLPPFSPELFESVYPERSLDEQIVRHFYSSYEGLRRAMGETGHREKSQEFLMMIYCLYIDPYLSIDKVKDALKDFKGVYDSTIRKIIYILKPINVEKILSPANYSLLGRINKSVNNVIADLNQGIKQRAPLVKKLEKLKQDIFYKQFSPLAAGIDRMKQEIRIYRNLVNSASGSRENLLSYYAIDKNLKKSPQKHKYWNDKVSGAIKIINKYSHNENCGSNCRKTHTKAIKKTAELLKLLYPSIWTENINIIADRIKQKAYRST